MSSPTLEDAIALAVKAHAGQTDKAGQPYILHPLRVMLNVAGEAERTAAILHDVVEDTDVTLNGLRGMGYPEEVLTAIDALTKRAGEDYADFVQRAAADPVARPVKIADIEDNLDIRRMLTLTDRDLDRLRRYREAWEMLNKAAN